MPSLTLTVTPSSGNFAINKTNPIDGEPSVIELNPTDGFIDPVLKGDVTFSDFAATDGVLGVVDGVVEITSITKSTVGLSDVDNTSDADKPVSTAQAEALALKADVDEPTLTGLVTVEGANGITTLLGGAYGALVNGAAGGFYAIGDSSLNQVAINGDGGITVIGPGGVAVESLAGSGIVHTTGTNGAFVTGKIVTGDFSEAIALPADSTAVTQEQVNNSAKIATTAYVRTAIDDLLGGTGIAEELNTIKELAEAIGDAGAIADIVAKTTDISYSDNVTTIDGTTKISPNHDLIFAAGVGRIDQFDSTGDNRMSAINLNNNKNLTFGIGSSGIISQAAGAGTNSLKATNFIGPVLLPDDTVSTAKIADGAVTNGKIDSMSASKLTDVPFATLASPSFTGNVGFGDATMVDFGATVVSGLNANTVGLGNVDNTSDADKPVSTAQQAALDAKANLAGATFTGNVVLANSTLNVNRDSISHILTVGTGNVYTRQCMNGTGGRKIYVIFEAFNGEVAINFNPVFDYQPMLIYGDYIDNISATNMTVIGLTDAHIVITTESAQSGVFALEGV